MLMSMTGYGRVCISSKYGKFTIEVQSLNRRFFESFIILPKEMMRFEVEIKNLLAKQVRRGQITVRIVKESEFTDVKDIVPDEILLDKLSNEWLKIAKKLKLPSNQVTLDFLASQAQLLTISKELKDEGQLIKILKRGLDQSIAKMNEMKQREGSALAEDIQKRLKFLSSQIAIIEKYAPDVVERLKKRLTKTLSEFIETDTIDERILKEIAIYSDKIDINEEILRLKSHINQFNKILSEEKDAVGRKMDFLIQEMIREINTIASKSSEVKISESVIIIKTELERIREQVQNIE